MTKQLIDGSSISRGYDSELISLEKTMREQHGDPVAAGSVGDYDLALSLFKQEGRTANAKQLLEAALTSNLNVAIFLMEMLDIGDRLMDKVPDEDFQSALKYVRERKQAWEETPGALAWLASYAVTVQLE